MGKKYNMEHDFNMVKFNYNTEIIGLKINIERDVWMGKIEQNWWWANGKWIEHNLNKWNNQIPFT